MSSLQEEMNIFSASLAKFIKGQIKVIYLLIAVNIMAVGAGYIAIDGTIKREIANRVGKTSVKVVLPNEVRTVFNMDEAKFVSKRWRKDGVHTTYKIVKSGSTEYYTIIKGK